MKHNYFVRRNWWCKLLIGSKSYRFKSFNGVYETIKLEQLLGGHVASDWGEDRSIRQSVRVAMIRAMANSLCWKKYIYLKKKNHIFRRTCILLYTIAKVSTAFTQRHSDKSCTELVGKMSTSRSTSNCNEVHDHPMLKNWIFYE